MYFFLFYVAFHLQNHLNEDARMPFLVVTWIPLVMLLIKAHCV